MRLSINALTHPDLGITASLSLIDLMEPNERRAVDNEILHFSNEVLQRRRAVGLAIRGHLAYIPTFNLPVTGAASNGDSIFIVNLEAREIVGEIPIQEGATPQQIVFINDQKLYVTCAAAHEVHVIDIPNRSTTKVLTGSFNKPDGYHASQRQSLRLESGMGVGTQRQGKPPITIALSQ